MSGQSPEGIIWKTGITRGVRTPYRPDRFPHAQSPGTGQWPSIDPAIRFDEHVLACVLSRALEEIDGGEATATEATGLSRADLCDVLIDRFPDVPISAFALEEATDLEPEMEEQLLRDLLLAHARPEDPASARFAKIIARRAMRDDHLWQDLGLFNRAELSRLLATHFPTLAAGNTKNMKWKKYLYRMLCEAEGFSICTAPSCRECSDFASCFGSEEDESFLARIRNDIDLN
ncbi:nitrogen fixation protein NifQ [Mesorhizobium sp. BHbsci]